MQEINININITTRPPWLKLGLEPLSAIVRMIPAEPIGTAIKALYRVWGGEEAAELEAELDDPCARLILGVLLQALADAGETYERRATANRENAKNSHKGQSKSNDSVANRYDSERLAAIGSDWQQNKNKNKNNISYPGSPSGGAPDDTEDTNNNNSLKTAETVENSEKGHGEESTQGITTNDATTSWSVEDRLSKADALGSVPAVKSEKPKAKRIRTYSADSPEYKTAVYLDELVKANYPALRPADERTLQKWADTLRLLHDHDGYDWDLIADMAEWAAQDEFWRKNIQSADSLRRQFAQLLVRSGRAG